ncbi:MAG: bis(5'-nucleosyl)-tetraphosphatase (symmetrical) YqeK [Clostridioides sp.]|jgi:predicted HD superfamily hydrolase involved in NAD metabolism|nr:bis(5'-nucleosyl)-tetraphosphatase (symmetrical) YqeK [Clostridioides sp.]
MNLEDSKLNLIENKLEILLKEGRLKHSYRVAECAKKLAKVYGYDEDVAYLAGLTHDAGKCLSDTQIKDYISKYEIYLDSMEDGNRALSHSVIGSYIVKYEFEIDDEDVINSVRYHTTGRENMSLLEKLIYLADLIEEGRDFSDDLPRLRELAYSGKLNEAMLLSFNNTLINVIEKNREIHPRSVRARNYILRELERK